MWWDTTNVLHDDDDLAMKARAMKSGVLRQSQVIASVVQTNSLKNKEVTGVVDALTGVACAEIKKNGHLRSLAC